MSLDYTYPGLEATREAMYHFKMKPANDEVGHSALRVMAGWGAEGGLAEAVRGLGGRQGEGAPLALDLASWGADPSELPWLDPPPEGQLDAARDLLRRLGAIERDAKGRVAVTPAGRRMANLPLHPRMARMVLWGASRGPESARLACQVAAVLGDRDVLRGRDAPADIRCRLGAMWDANGKGARLVASAPTSSPPPPLAKGF